MRKQIGALGLAVVFANVPAPASAAAVLFNGVLAIRSTTSACGILPYLEQGGLFRAVYRPAGVANNGLSTSLILVPMLQEMNDLLVTSYRLSNDSLNANFKQVDVGQTTSTRQLSLNFTQYSAQMRIAHQAPGDVDGADYLSLTLQIRKFGGVIGCSVTLRGFVGVGDSLTAGRAH
jgi:hypothetical protein